MNIKLKISKKTIFIHFLFGIIKSFSHGFYFFVFVSPCSFRVVLTLVNWFCAPNLEESPKAEKSALSTRELEECEKEEK